MLEPALQHLACDPDAHVRAMAAEPAGKFIHTDGRALTALKTSHAQDPSLVVRKKAGWFTPGGPLTWFDDQMDADAIVIGAGLAELTATAELIRAGRSVLLLDQEPESNLGGQAFWSFGGLFLVGSPEQRRLGIRDSRELAWQDWLGSAFFDRGADDPAGRTTGHTGRGAGHSVFPPSRAVAGPSVSASAASIALSARPSAEGIRWP